jgi:hypothetical protein
LKKFAGVKENLKDIPKIQEGNPLLESQSRLRSFTGNFIDNVGNHSLKIVKKIISAKGRVLDDLGLTNENDIEEDEDEFYGDESNETIRQSLIKKYGVLFEIPAYNYFNAKFVPHMRNHIVTMAHHILPKGNNTV